MKIVLVLVLVIVAVLLLGGAMAARIVRQYEDGALFRFGRVIGERKPRIPADHPVR